jgi:hypothetical protein
MAIFNSYVKLPEGNIEPPLNRKSDIREKGWTYLLRSKAGTAEPLVEADGSDLFCRKNGSAIRDYIGLQWSKSGYEMVINAGQPTNMG